jgi:SSS family solute:Na+ symporter
LHFALLLFLLCSIILVVASYSTPPPALAQVQGITYDYSTKIKIQSKFNLGLSIGLVLLIAVLWYEFS